MGTATEDELTDLVRWLHLEDASQPNRTNLLYRILKNVEADWPCETEPVHDRVDAIGERKALLDQWTVLCDKYNAERPNMVATGVFLVAPVHILKHQIGIASDADALFFFPTMHDIVQTTSYEAIRWFLGKGSRMKATANPTTPTKASTAKATLGPGVGFSPSESSPLTRPPMTSSPPPQQASSSASHKRKAVSPAGSGQGATKHARSASNPDPDVTASLPMPDPLAATPPPASPAASVTSSASASSVASRSRKAAQSAIVRDGNRCVLSGYSFPEAAHVFPFSATKAPDTALKCIGSLATLWGGDLHETWTGLIANPEVTESARNLICLNRHLHALWGAACFGLKPLCTAEDAAATGQVRLQFHWLPKGRCLPKQPLEDASEDTLRKIVEDGDVSDFVAHRKSGIPIETGQVFTIEAEDPDDLPSVDLLQLQWNLLQVASMAGFAEVLELEGDMPSDDCGNEAGEQWVESEDNDDVPNLLLDDSYSSSEDENQSEFDKGSENSNNGRGNRVSSDQDSGTQWPSSL